jgi:hypothetical protein
MRTSALACFAVAVVAGCGGSVTLAHRPGENRRYGLSDADDLSELHENGLFGSPASWVGGLEDAPALASKLREAKDPVSQYLLDRLPADVRDMVAEDGGGRAPRERLHAALVRGLNEILNGASIYDAQVFAGVDLDQETDALVHEELDGDDLVRLNRDLLHAAYPDLIWDRWLALCARFAVSPPESYAPMIFADCRTVIQCHPVILVKERDGWKGIRLEARQQGWEYVGASANGDELWAVLDGQVEGHSWELTLVNSEDRGKTWCVVSTVRKTCYYAGFHDFAMADDGSGRVTILLCDDYNDETRAGMYHYRTSDGGRTWSLPEWEPSAVHRVWVPDEKEGIRKLMGYFDANYR